MVVKSTERMRCAACGAYLSELPSVGMRSVSAYLLPKGRFKPQFHVQCANAVLPVLDDLPHYKGFTPSAGLRNLSPGDDGADRNSRRQTNGRENRLGFAPKKRVIRPQASSYKTSAAACPAHGGEYSPDPRFS